MDRRGSAPVHELFSVSLVDVAEIGHQRAEHFNGFGSHFALVAHFVPHFLADFDHPLLYVFR